MSGPIEDQAFLLWEELPDTESGQIKILIFLTGTWRKLKKEFAYYSGLGNFFCKGPNRKCIRFCRPGVLLSKYSVLL